jgi:hypothetical protein
VTTRAKTGRRMKVRAMVTRMPLRRASNGPRSNTLLCGGGAFVDWTAARVKKDWDSFLGKEGLGSEVKMGLRGWGMGQD